MATKVAFVLTVLFTIGTGVHAGMLTGTPCLRVVSHVVCEPLNISMFLLGGGALGIRGWRKRKLRSAEKIAA